jgi:hypothetical protein
VGDATIEVSTVGIDEALAGLSSDPFGASVPTSLGLRIPAFVPANGERYLFLLASREVVARQRVRVRGWRQYLTIGYNGASGVPSNPVELAVTTPNFRFPDGNVSWHLVREPGPLSNATLLRPNTDLASFMFADSSTPALLYQSYTQSANTGFYMLNLTSYVAPTQRRATWEPIAASLGNVRDLRAPWDDAHSWNSLDVNVQGPCRVSLYASVLQTNPNTRSNPVIPVTGGPPEQRFIADVSGLELEGLAVNFWRVAGALIFDDCVCVEEKVC